jgi:type I restriction enzyme, S subunit
MESGASAALGPVPDDWDVRRFDELFAIQQGKQVKKAAADGETRPFLRTRNVLWGALDLIDLDEMPFTSAEETRLALAAGDLLICEGGDIGRSAVWNGERERCYYQNHLHRARAIDPGTIDPQFALYWLWYAFEVGRVYFGRGNVTTIPNLSKSRLGELPMPLPVHLEEQRTIAQTLHLIEEAIAAREAVIAHARELKEAVVAHLLSANGGGYRWSEGRRDEEWPTVRLGDMCRLSTGSTPATERAEYYDGDVPLIKTTEIANSRITASGTHISEQAVSDYSLRKLPPGTVLMAMYGQGKTRGQVGLLEITATITQNAAAIQCREGLDPEYLWHYLLTRYAHLRGSGALGHISHLNLGYVADVPVPVPPVPDQRAIVAILNSIDARVTGTMSEVARLRELFQALITELMTARIRVPNAPRQAVLPAEVGVGRG